jgi:hypothetical protein
VLWCFVILGRHPRYRALTSPGPAPPLFSSSDLQPRISNLSLFNRLRTLPFERQSDEDSRPERAQRSEGSLCFLLNGLRTLLFCVSSKSFVCPSYENCRGIPKQFPFWNRVPRGRRSLHSLPRLIRSTVNSRLSTCSPHPISSSVLLCGCCDSELCDFCLGNTLRAASRLRRPACGRRAHPLRLSPVTSHESPVTFPIFFRINTSESASKQATLTSFRMNTSTKTGEGASAPPAALISAPPVPSAALLLILFAFVHAAATHPEVN